MVRFMKISLNHCRHYETSNCSFINLKICSFRSALTESEFKKTKMYANSKLACLLYARELADQASASNYPMYVNIASPGFVKTNLGREVKYKWLLAILMAPTFLFILRTPKQGMHNL